MIRSLFHGAAALMICSASVPLAAQTFAPPTVLDGSINGAFGVAAGDLNGDGLPDLVSAAKDADAIYWHAALPAGGYGIRQTVTASLNDVRSVVCADLDGDGDIDVAASAVAGDKHRWYANDGSGNFGSGQFIANGNGAIAILDSDIDADGDVDLVFCELLSDRVGLALNDGSGSFSITNVGLTQNGPRSVDVADMDGDGRLDILAASRYDGKAVWYQNMGGYVFEERLVGTVGGMFSIAAGDIDGDGLQDVVSAINTGDRLVWFKNNGDSTYSAAITISTDLDETMEAIVADMDGNGTMDVVSASRSDDKIALYTNVGGGLFSPQVELTASADGATDVIAFDLDGDGDLDLASSSEFDDRVRVFENLGDSVLLPDSCVVPEVLDMTAVNPYTATVSWSGRPFNLGYRLEGRIAGSAFFRTATTTDTFRTVGGLFPGTTYEWQLTVKCMDGSLSDVSPLQTYTAPLPRESASNSPSLAGVNASGFVIHGLPTGSQVRVVDMAGRMVHHFQSTASVEALDASAWASGLYLVEWRSPEGENGTFKLVRE